MASWSHITDCLVPPVPHTHACPVPLLLSFLFHSVPITAGSCTLTRHGKKYRAFSQPGTALSPPHRGTGYKSHPSLRPQASGLISVPDTTPRLPQPLVGQVTSGVPTRPSLFSRAAPSVFFLSFFFGVSVSSLECFLPSPGCAHPRAVVSF